MTFTFTNRKFDGLEHRGLISKYGWKARFDRQPEVRCKPFNLPRLSQIKSFIPMAFRYTFRFYLKKRLIEKRLPFIDPSQHVPWKPIYGVPMGGLGCGAIGRGFRGEFTRSSLIPGMYSYDSQPADQFILTIKRMGQTVYHQVLSPEVNIPAFASGLRSWSWDFPAENGHYIGLYPRSWTVYEVPLFHLILVCQQISPVIPHDYKDSCLPACVFVWTVLNYGSEPLEVTVSFSWHGPNPVPRNNIPSDGAHRKRSVHSNGESCNGSVKSVSSKDPVDDFLYLSSSFRCSKNPSILGCTLDRIIGNELPCCFGVAAKASDTVRVSRCPGYSLQSKKQPSGKKRQSTEIPDEISFRSCTEAPSARTVWDELQSSSGLTDVDSIGYHVPKTPTSQRKDLRLAILVSATCTAPPAKADSELPGQAQLEFAVVWHAPIVWFRGSEVIYKRRYARWFPEPGMSGAEDLLEYALEKWPLWVQKIYEWQNPILNNTSLPDWYKSALFNELYYLTDGGTVWLDPLEIKNLSFQQLSMIPIDLVRAFKGQCSLDPLKLTGRHLDSETADQSVDCDKDFKLDSWKYRSQLGTEMGLFGYLEGHEYRMYNTVDVHYNSSWAFIKLWPKLQLAMLFDCADLAIEEDQTRLYFVHEGRYGIRSTESAVPHDFGDPEDEPWRYANAYVMYPTNDWKDLNSKFVMQVWRDWKLTRDDQYLLYMLPIINRLIEVSLQAWDSDGDGMIENSGFPDQTYDTWSAHGISAYTGGLWLACMYCACEMLDYALAADSPLSRFLLDSKLDRGVSWSQVHKELQVLLENAKHVYDGALWTGSYYAYQNRRVGNHESVMADQLSGHGFLRLTGAPSDAILPNEHVITALKTIQNLNWHSIADGSLGVINGGLPGAKRDLSNVQAEEFWVGINYSLAATMILEGMSDEAMSLAGACYNTIYNRFGLQYQTPEAYMMDGRFRCPGYMRPLAIWGIQRALELTQQYKNQSNPTDTIDNTGENKFHQSSEKVPSEHM